MPDPRSPAGAVLRALFRPFLLLLALLLVLVEDFLWAGMRKIGARLALYAPWARMEAWIGSLPPYGAGACLLVPFVLLTPLNLLAVHFFSIGAVGSGLLALAAEKLGAIFIVERVFHAASPSLLTLRWFKTIHDWVVSVRARVLDAARATEAWRRARLLVEAARPILRSAASRVQRLLPKASFRGKPA